MPTKKATENKRHHLLLPSQTAADFFKQRLLPDDRFQRFYKHFTAQGFKFIPERVQLIVGVGPVKGQPLAEPFTLAIVPSFRKFAKDAPSHEAVSIVVMRTSRINTVVAGTVTIGHRPYQVQSLGLAEFTEGGEMAFRVVEREQLLKQPAKSLAKALASTRTAQQFTVEEPGLDPDDLNDLATTIYYNLLNDKYAKPLYPPAGLKSMMAETQIVQTFAMTNRLRAARAAAASSYCTSTSTSSNACTSTSTSSFSLSL